MVGAVGAVDDDHAAGVGQLLGRPGVGGHGTLELTGLDGGGIAGAGHLGDGHILVGEAGVGHAGSGEGVGAAVDAQTAGDHAALQGLQRAVLGWWHR